MIKIHEIVMSQYDDNGKFKGLISLGDLEHQKEKWNLTRSEYHDHLLTGGFSVEEAEEIIIMLGELIPEFFKED